LEISKGKIIVISSPSGGGKTTILKAVLKYFPEMVFSVSATTRTKRSGEVDGVDYFFLSEKEFFKKIDNGVFIEWEKVYDYYYGTLKNFVESNINSGKNVIFDVDVKGALSIKKNYKDASLIYIYPPNLEELMKRLRKRNTESEEELKKRAERAKMELSLKDKFDYLILNDNLDFAIVQLKSLIDKIIKENN
jgi:guanylate kinase